MILESVAQHLEDDGVGVRGQSIFINFIPQGNEGILLRDPFGGFATDPELPAYYRGYFMLITRGREYVRMKTLIEQAVDSLRSQGPRQIGDMQVKYLLPRSLPFSYANSVGDQIEFIVNMDGVFFDVR